MMFVSGWIIPSHSSCFGWFWMAPYGSPFHVHEAMIRWKWSPNGHWVGKVMTETSPSTDWVQNIWYNHHMSCGIWRYAKRCGEVPALVRKKAPWGLVSYLARHYVWLKHVDPYEIWCLNVFDLFHRLVEIDWNSRSADVRDRLILTWRWYGQKSDLNWQLATASEIPNIYAGEFFVHPIFFVKDQVVLKYPVSFAPISAHEGFSSAWYPSMIPEMLLSGKWWSYRDRNSSWFWSQSSWAGHGRVENCVNIGANLGTFPNSSGFFWWFSHDFGKPR